MLTEYGGDDGGGAPDERDASGRTMLTLTVLYPTKAARDAAIASGIEQRMAGGYARLEAMLAAAPARGNSRDAA